MTKKKIAVTQDAFDEAVKKAATKKESKVKKKETPPKIKVKAGLGRDPESDEEWLQNIEKKYNQLKERKSSTALILMSEFAFLLELARE